MSQTQNIVQKILLSPFQLDENQLAKVLHSTLSATADYADIYLQQLQAESWFLEESIIKEGSFSIETGFGLRVLDGERTGFAHADDFSMATLTQAAQTAKGIALHQGERQVAIQSQKPVEKRRLYHHDNPLQSTSDSEKIRILKYIDAHARAVDPRVKQVMANLSASHEWIWVMNSEGLVTADIRPMVSLSLRIVVEENGQCEIASSGGGLRGDYAYFTDELLDRFVNKAVRQAVLKLSAKSAPAGMMPVILGAGWPAVLLHEAVGHGLEADFNRKGSSVFSGKIGQKVAASHCTIVDDGTIEHRRGSLNVDDEGTVSQRTVLIENGILKNYLQDRHNAKLMNMSPTGNGRRQSYAHLPMPRMTNTYMLGGSHTAGEMISSVKRGIYAVDFAGGQVDITSGNFVFTTSEAYLIENGKVTTPIKGVTLIGNGPEVIQKISMLGNDLALDEGIGSCGKAGQTLPVGVGQPTLKVDELTVGGASA